MAAAIVKKLQTKKERIIKSAKQFEDYLNKINNLPTKTEVNGIQMRIKDFLPENKRLEDIADELATLDVDISEEAYEFKDKYLDLLLSANSKLPREEIQTNGQVTSGPPQARLPVMDVPSFSGNYDNWTHFSDLFVSLIHNNTELTNVQKFHYLQGALTGEAASILKCVKISDVGYELAWNRLKKRYQNERFIFKKHMHNLLNLPNMKKDDYISLRHLIDTLDVNISSLKDINRATEHYGDFIVELVPDKLDVNLRKEWEGRTCGNIPTLEDLQNFLETKCKQLEAYNDRGSNVSATSGSHRAKVLHTNTFERKCSFCGDNHMIYKCETFSKMSVSERISATKQNRLCFNCLGKNHSAKSCSSGSCRVCDKFHHTMLHITQKSNPSKLATPISAVGSSSSAVNLAYAPSNVLLSTCKVLIQDVRGRKQEVRALLDTGSQANLITESCAKRLGLRHINTNVPIVAVGGDIKSLNNAVCAKISSRVSNFNLSVSALVIEKITDLIPSRWMQFESSQIPAEVCLADPEFYEPREIDLLIGNGHYQDIVRDGRLKMNSLSLYNTHFGWIMYGQLPDNRRSKPQNNTIVSLVGLSEIVSKFWEMESYKNQPLAPADERCEEHFHANTKRDKTGRFEVALPFREDPRRLGDSSESAKRRFFALERRLTKSPDIYAEYRTFMQEYLELGHMKKTKGDVKRGYYLPHHCVIKQDSLTTKLRVVNDILMVGPPVQSDLFSIMARMRCWKYVVTADIAKMYRQVRVRPEDTKYQRIWWRSSPEEYLTSYELTTVTYGTSSAAFLAIRALHELAQNLCSDFPIGSHKYLSDFYVDDLITGANTLCELKQVRDQVNSLLASGGFELKRWVSINTELFIDFKPNCVDNVTVLTRDNNYAGFITTLGTMWNTASDTLTYKCNVLSSRANTKRSILSEILRVYDPLGLIGPIIITGKILIQDLWKTRCGWDDPLPDTFTQRWLEYAENLKQLILISIPRVAALSSEFDLELHGFSDASENAYGACIYVVGVRIGERVFSNLLCAKSRVAPVKATSIPRLELCAAVLLAELCDRIRDSLKHLQYKCIYYSDSTITLSWIKSDSRRFKTFIANRIGEIHKLTDPQSWYHVATKENPADLISRGATVEILRNCKLWWRGPAFLLDNKLENKFIPADSPPELKCNLACASNKDIIIPKCSSFEKSVRVMAYVLRFMSKLRARNVTHSGPLTILELNQATNVLIRNLQCASFYRERKLLNRGANVPKGSKLITLNPFLDSNGLIRVGGRLTNSELPTNRRCPVVLPANHELINL